MLQVAAGRSAAWQSQVRDYGLRLREGANWKTIYDDQHQAKLFFMQHDWNHTSAAFYIKGKKYSDGFHFQLILNEHEMQCLETADTASKMQLVQWLVQQGFTLPEYSFIIHSCDFPIAKFLLECRLKTDSFIHEQFEDAVPLAMVCVKQFLYRNAQEASLTATDAALLCVQRPAYDELLCISDACRLLLLDWLDSRGYVNLVRAKTSSGDSILHEAVLQQGNCDCHLVGPQVPSARPHKIRL